MKMERSRLLMIVAGAAVALWLLDIFVIEPGFAGWKAQSERIADLRKQVSDGDKLVTREKVLRDHWADMMRQNLPVDNSAAENDAYKAIARWERDARVVFTNLSKDKQWKQVPLGPKPTDGSYETLQFTISINGDQTSIGRFIYEMENDTIPVNLETCDLTSHDARGTQLTLAATFTFLRLPQANGGTR